jgi:hypothetical protein
VTAVFRIREILIRIRILGSVQWITDPDPGLFVNDFQDAKKIKSLRSHKKSKSRFILSLLLVDGRIRIRKNYYGYGSGSGGPKNLPGARAVNDKPITTLINVLRRN